MPPFATTGGISGVELKAASRAARNTTLFTKSRNHRKVPEIRRPMGTFCALHSADIGSAFSALGGFGPRSLWTDQWLMQELGEGVAKAIPDPEIPRPGRTARVSNRERENQLKLKDRDCRCPPALDISLSKNQTRASRVPHRCAAQGPQASALATRPFRHRQ
jgi:hypothetical protein